MCFRCDERYFPSHRCKTREKRELNLLIVHEEEEEEVGEEVVKGEETEMKVLEVADNVEIALRSLLGFPMKGTMKLKGSVASKEVIAMIDCGTKVAFTILVPNNVIHLIWSYTL